MSAHAARMSVGRKRWNPLHLTSVVEWWRADAGVSLSSGKVAAWTGLKNGRLLLQSTASKQPTFVASETATAQRPCIRFDHTLQQFLRSNLPVSDWRSPGVSLASSLYLVLRTTASTGAWNVMLSTWNGSTNRAGIYISPRRSGTGSFTTTHLSSWQGTGSGVGSPGVAYSEIENEGQALGSVTYVALRHTAGATLRMRTGRHPTADTEVSQAAPALTPTDPQYTLAIGAMPEGNTWLGGEIYEVLVCDADLADADDLRMRTYMRERYAIA